MTLKSKKKKNFFQKGSSDSLCSMQLTQNSCDNLSQYIPQRNYESFNRYPYANLSKSSMHPLRRGITILNPCRKSRNSIRNMSSLNLSKSSMHPLRRGITVLNPCRKSRNSIRNMSSLNLSKSSMHPLRRGITVLNPKKKKKKKKPIYMSNNLLSANHEGCEREKGSSFKFVNPESRITHSNEWILQEMQKENRPHIKYKSHDDWVLEPQGSRPRSNRMCTIL